MFVDEVKKEIRRLLESPYRDYIEKGSLDELDEWVNDYENNPKENFKVVLSFGEQIQMGDWIYTPEGQKGFVTEITYVKPLDEKRVQIIGVIEYMNEE